MRIFSAFALLFLGYASLANAAVSEADRDLGKRLKAAQARGLLILEGTAKPQIDQLINKGYIEVTYKERDAAGNEVTRTKQLNISAGLHTFFDALLDDATARNKTFGIMSLAAYRGPHGGGTRKTTKAVDLSLYHNYSMRIDRYSGVYLGLIDLLEVLPAHHAYNMGLPRTAYKVGEAQRNCPTPKDGNACDKKNYSYRIDADVFARPEKYEYFLAAKYNESWPLHNPNRDDWADLAFVQHAAYREGLVTATKAAVARNVSFSGWMADSLDHLHVAVDTDEGALP